LLASRFSSVDICGAISIDLLHAVLVFIMIIVEGAIRREGATISTPTMSAADVMRGAELYRQMQARFAPENFAPPPPFPSRRKRPPGAAAQRQGTAIARLCGAAVPGEGRPGGRIGAIRRHRR
jgi:hypothetical protein